MVPFMGEPLDLKRQIKKLMIDNLMLQVTEAEITDALPLFGPGGLGLDSVDALQLVVALDKQFHLKIADPAAARTILQSVNTIAQAVEAMKVGGPETSAR
jgi:acyl carrier protein